MKQTKSKQRLLFVLKELYQNSDEKHPISCGELILRCSEQGFGCDRKAIYNDLQALEESGFDILYTRTPRQGYFLASRLFEAAELRLVRDSLQASRMISPKKKQRLFQKLSALGSKYDAVYLNAPSLPEENKTVNEGLFYTIDLLLKAIDENHPVSFYYYDLDLNRQKVYRRNKARYTLIPYALIWENQRYYCIGMDERHDNFSHWRIDKMDYLLVLDETASKRRFDLSEYSSRVFGMFQGPLENVVLRAERSLLNVIFDQFGQDVLISEVTETHFVVHLLIGVAPPLVSWLFQFEGRIEVLAPASFIETMKKTAQSVLSLYE